MPYKLVPPNTTCRSFWRQRYLRWALAIWLASFCITTRKRIAGTDTCRATIRRPSIIRLSRSSHFHSSTSQRSLRDSSTQLARRTTRSTSRDRWTATRATTTTTWRASAAPRMTPPRVLAIKALSNPIPFRVSANRSSSHSKSTNIRQTENTANQCIECINNASSKILQKLVLIIFDIYCNIGLHHRQINETSPKWSHVSFEIWISSVAATTLHREFMHASMAGNEVINDLVICAACGHFDWFETSKRFASHLRLATF